MKNSILILIKVFALKLLFCSSLFAQTFNKTYVSSGQLYDFQTAICAIDGKVLNAKTIVEIPNNFRTKINIDFLSENGEIIWSKQLQTLDANYSLRLVKLYPISNTEFIIIGQYMLNNDIDQLRVNLIKMNTNGNIIWDKKINNSTFTGVHSVLKLSNSNLLVQCTEIEGNLGYYSLLLLDLDGNKINSKRLNVAEWDFNYSEVANSDGTFDIATSEFDILNINNDLSAINSNKKYKHYFGYVMNRTSNGDYIYAVSQQVVSPSHINLFRTDSNNNIIWAKHIETWDLGNQNNGTVFNVTGFSYIRENSAGNIECLAHSMGFAKGSLFLEINNNGTIVNSKRKTTSLNSFDTDETNYVCYNAGVAQQVDNTVIKIGKFDMTTDYQCDVNTLQHSIIDQNPIVMTPLSNLVLTSNPNLTLSNTDVLAQNISNLTELSECLPVALNDSNFETFDTYLFPNPNNGSFTINSNLTLGKSNISIYNTLGQSIDFEYSNSKLVINTIQTGIYYLKVEMDGKYIFTKKIVVK